MIDLAFSHVILQKKKVMSCSTSHFNIIGETFAKA